MTDPELQCYNNVVYGLKHLQVFKYFYDLCITQVDQDRVILRCWPTLEDALDEHSSFGRWSVFQNHGADAYASWRENVGTCSMQITLHRRGNIIEAEIDYDYGRPGWDLVGWAIHAWEFATNVILGLSKTNPYTIRKMLNARGYEIPLVKPKDS